MFISFHANGIWSNMCSWRGTKHLIQSFVNRTYYSEIYWWWLADRVLCVWHAYKRFQWRSDFSWNFHYHTWLEIALHFKIIFFHESEARTAAFRNSTKTHIYPHTSTPKKHLLHIIIIHVILSFTMHTYTHTNDMMNPYSIFKSLLCFSFSTHQ